MEPLFTLIIELNLEQNYLVNDKSKIALRNRLPELTFLIIDELSVVSSGLWIDIDSRREKYL